MWDEYTWIFICSIFLAFFVTWGIGANDVANAFGTSVGARALTLKQAICVAAVCEFAGAVLLGSGVTDTIKSGIAKPAAYTDKPELLMYGMMCVLLATGIWLAAATFMELPVSTTHSVIGAIIGMSLIAAGPHSVIWSTPADPANDKPLPGGFVAIVLAWFITPAMACVVAGLLFTFTKIVVLKAKNPFKVSLFLYPLFTFITVWVVTYFVIQKGVNGWMKSKTYSSGSCPPGADWAKKNPKTGSVTGCAIPDSTNAWISAVTAAVCTIGVLIALKWIIKLINRDLRMYEEQEAATLARAQAHAEGKAEAGGVEKDPKEGSDEGVTVSKSKSFLSRSFRAVAKPFIDGANVDVHECAVTDTKIREMHQIAEVFDRKTELSFKYLQVLTACSNSFAHGANDVANGIGPLAAIYAIWQCACVNSKSNVPIWMFVIGGFGLVAGLSTYGYNIMRALGIKMTKLTNARGYCAELTAAIIVIVSSRYGFPVSTTQVITGAIAGIGITEAISCKIAKKPTPGKAFNWLILLKFFAGWVATLIVAGFTAAAFTAQGIYAPSFHSVNYRAQFNQVFNQTNAGIAKTLAAPAFNATDATPPQRQAFKWGVEIAAATAAVTKSNNLTLLNPAAYLAVFQKGSWYLGNSTVAGVFPDAFMPTMPLSAIRYSYN